MKFRSLFALALCFAVTTADAALITSAAAGNSSAGATWTGGVVPGLGDRVAINHAVTADTAWTIGDNRPTQYQGTRPAASATGTGGSLPVGNGYKVKLAPANAVGETSPTVQPSFNVNITTAGQVIQVTLPTLTAGATSWTIYLTEAGGTVYRRYATGKLAGTFDCASSLWENGTTAFASASDPVQGEAVRIGSTGSLTFADGVKLTANGDFAYRNNVTISPTTLAAGIEFDPTTSGATYRLYGGDPTGNNTGTFTMRGSASVRPYVRTKAGATPEAQIAGMMQTTGSFGLLRPDWQFAHISRMGNTSYPGLEIGNNTAYTLLMSDCLFDTCGRFSISTAIPATGGFNLARNTWVNSNAETGSSTLPECFLIASTTSPNVGVDRIIDSNVFDQVANLPTFGSVITGNYFDIGYVTQSSGATPSAELSGFFIRFDPRRSSHATGLHSPSNGYFLFDSTSAQGAIVNPHGFQAAYDGQSWTGNVFEHNGDDGNGDCVYTFGVAGTFTVANNLSLPEPGGKSSGTLTLQFNNTHASCLLNLYHNTICNATGTTVICEGGSQPVGTLTNVKSNLYYRDASPPIPGAQGGYKVALANGSYTGIANDILPPANATHNAIVNGRTTQNDGTTPITKNYNYPHTTAPGTNDVDLGTGVALSSVFVDPTRNFTSWSRTVLGKTGTDAQVIAAGLAALRARNQPNHADYHASATIAGLRTWVRDGWAVKDARLQNAGHDAVTIGAVEFVSSVLTAPTVTLDSKTDTTVTLSWPAATGGTAPYTYDIQQSPAGANTWTTVATNVTSPHTVTGLTSNTAYDFRIRVTDSAP